jgi:hypothetical protein
MSLSRVGIRKTAAGALLASLVLGLHPAAIVRAQTAAAAPEGLEEIVVTAPRIKKQVVSTMVQAEQGIGTVLDGFSQRLLSGSRHGSVTSAAHPGRSRLRAWSWRTGR